MGHVGPCTCTASASFNQLLIKPAFVFYSLSLSLLSLSLVVLSCVSLSLLCLSLVCVCASLSLLSLSLLSLSNPGRRGIIMSRILGGLEI